jgi:hypothetical protein
MNMSSGSMLRLVWKHDRDNGLHGSVIGDPESIRDLYWQLTQNYSCEDGTKIGSVYVSTLTGQTLTSKEVMQTPYEYASVSYFEG